MQAALARVSGGRFPGGLLPRQKHYGGQAETTTGYQLPTLPGEWHLLKLILPYRMPQKPNDSRTRRPYVSAIHPAGLISENGSGTHPCRMDPKNLMQPWQSRNRVQAKKGLGLATRSGD